MSKETPKTFKELFANTGIEPATDEKGNIHYNFKAKSKGVPKPNPLLIDEAGQFDFSKRETFENYLERLKERRTEDDYKYTDKDLEDNISYIEGCWEQNLSVYKCLEWMYFYEETREKLDEHITKGLNNETTN